MTDTIAEFWSIKYLTARGIENFTGKFKQNPRASYAIRPGPFGCAEKVGSDAFFSLKEAENAAMLCYEKKIKTAEKQIDKYQKALNKLKFSRGLGF